MSILCLWVQCRLHTKLITAVKNFIEPVPRLRKTQTCSDLDDEGDGDPDGEDEHGEDDDPEAVDGFAGFAGSSAARKGWRRLLRNWQIKVVIFFLCLTFFATPKKHL